MKNENEEKVILESRKKRQKILQEVEELLEWRHDLLEVDIRELVDQLAETREGAVAIEDVNQAYLALHGVTLVRKEKDQALFWLSRLQDFSELLSIQRVIDDLWKKEHFRSRVLEGISREMQRSSLLIPQVFPLPARIEATTDKLRELVDGILPFVDLRLVMRTDSPREEETTSLDETIKEGISDIMKAQMALSREKHWLQDLDQSWFQLCQYLTRNDFFLGDLLAEVPQFRDRVLVLQFIGLLVDVGMLNLDSEGHVSVSGHRSQEFLQSMVKSSQWDVDAFIRTLREFITSSREELLPRDAVVLSRSVIISSGDFSALNE